ncbi:LLM class flavin-dependent oxidoreductase [Fodinicola acaciae]|uniref:LLM class flavin-dependent oxidoreductase n=1 Tax=Fodinicola acaciae TaxID=2681555 RepID=UPI0013D6EA5A|nr:LLM class flavin-dependent oxidoreductase [Fodinicola acaciae]
MTAFRFGVVAVPQGAKQWLDTARRVEELGYSTLLSPDNLRLVTPTASLAAAAAVTTKLRVGSFVLASPLRTPRAAAWEAHSVATVSGGRFELGLGTGLPAMKEAAAELGLPYENAAGRIRQVTETIDHVRKLDGDIRVLVAAGGPKMRAAAGAKADIVALAGGPFVTRDEMAAAAAEVRDAAGSREVELSLNLFVVGDEAPPFVSQLTGAAPEELIKRDSLLVLRGSEQEMVDELQRRRDALGTSYVTVNGAFTETFAPIVERLAGR